MSPCFISYDCSIIATLFLSGCDCEILAKRETVKKPIEIRMMGYEVMEKTAKNWATSARALVPKHWIGRRVRVVNLHP